MPRRLLASALALPALVAVAAAQQPAPNAPAAPPSPPAAANAPAAPQPRPALPQDYFDNIEFRLPAGFSLADSAATDREFRRIAGLVRRAADSAEANFAVTDTNQLRDIVGARAGALLVLGDYAALVPEIARERALDRTPDYVMPFFSLGLPYARAALAGGDTGAAFGPRLAAAVRAELAALPAEHRADLANSIKGSYGAGASATLRRTVEQVVEQARATGRLTFDNALTAITVRWQAAVRARYGPVLLAEYYAVSPARVVEDTVRIPMRDGVRLSALLYRDAARTARVPALVSLSPYPGGGEATRGNVFASNGYAWLYVDTRGRRGSEGTFVPYEQDARDYYDIIDWASKQPWCDGQVATTGGSYLGFAQWQAARKAYRHPALKAINPMVAVGFGVDFPRESNVFYSYILQWATFVSGRELNVPQFQDFTFWQNVAYRAYRNHVPFAKLDSVAGLPNAYFQTWVRHPDYDGYWQGVMPTPADYAALDIPVLTITGYSDADQVGALHYYDAHMRWGTPAAKAQHHLLIGPYDHGGAQWTPGPVVDGRPVDREALVPIYKYVLQWFDWRLKGAPRPAWIKGPVTYYAGGTGEWRGAASFAAAARDTMRLYLTGAVVPNAKRSDVRALAAAPPPAAAAPVVYRHDVAAVLDSAFLFSYDRPGDDTRYLTSPHNLVFETPPLDRDVLLTGRVVPRLVVALNVPDADFMASVYEVTPEGKSWPVGQAVARARYRRGGDRPRLMTPGVPDTISFPNVFVDVRRLARGSRLRLVFESVNTPQYEKNYGFGGVVAQETSAGPRIVEARLLPGSVLLVPYADGPAARPRPAQAAAR